MRATYRAHGGIQAYWQARWEAIPPDEGNLSLERYPGAFANELMSRLDGPVLEAGCGAGRVLRYFHDRNREIVGIDLVPAILHKLHASDPTTRLASANILCLPFRDETFAGALAFGLYHNLETGLEEALTETCRVIRPNGLICASFRADNIQNHILDKISDRQSDGSIKPEIIRSSIPKKFHKMNYKKWELNAVFNKSGFTVESVRPVENMPFLYKLSRFRAAAHKEFDEQQARAIGYRLSSVGRRLQNLLTTISPAEFCNVYVVVARRRQAPPRNSLSMESAGELKQTPT